MLESFPAEIKQYNQWCITTRGNKRPMLENNGVLYNASVTGDNFLSFNDAVQLAYKYDGRVGFVLTRNDPFVCIDVDIKDCESLRSNGESLEPFEYTSIEKLRRYEKVLYVFDSYAERSLSTKGIHIWIKGNIPAGNQRDGVDVYPHERFIVCTGDVVSSLQYHIDEWLIYPEITGRILKPVYNRQDILNDMISDMVGQSANVKSFDLVEVAEQRSDQEIFNLACNAANAEKFITLARGDWKACGYPSQSEADLALLSMIAFYTDSNEQVRRMFRKTELGKREKATKDNVYIDRTLKGIRSRRAQQQAIEINLDKQVEQLNEDMAKKKDVKITDEIVPVDWPPGKAGELAKFIYNSSPRPVKEVSITGALGLLAGICGKAYTVYGSGLNVYIILIARSGTGKEAMHSGIDLIMDRLLTAVPRASTFVDKSGFVSGPALIKACSVNQSFVNVNGEWGRTFKRIMDEKRYDPAMQQLRTVMTDLYQKSGPTSVVGGLKYSSKENNVESVKGVAYSMIGETTPSTFYDSISESSMEDGFLSRFTTIQYLGERPASNENRMLVLDDKLTSALCTLITYVLQILDNRSHLEIKLNRKATKLEKEFDKECDFQINQTHNEAFRQMWTRAHLKVLRIAGILAVFNNHINPVITEQEFAWALNLVKWDIRVMTHRVMAGDIGTGDDSRDKKLLSLLQEFLDAKTPAGYRVPDELFKKRIIPKRILTVRTTRLRMFTEHKNGSAFALNAALKNLQESGFVSELSDQYMLDNFGRTYGKCYRILNIQGY